MRVEDSLTMNMITYKEPEEMIRSCLTAFFASIRKYPKIKLILLDDFPGWDFSDNVKFVAKDFPQVKMINNLMNQGQARNWNQITRLALMDSKEFCGVIAPDTLVYEGWVEKINQHINEYSLFHHLNFSVWRTEVIKRLKWWDERHVSGGSEDLDIYFRFEEAGIPYSRTLLKQFEKRRGSNQYRDTEENVKQFNHDNEYWLAKWRKDKTTFPRAIDIWNNPKIRERNWDDIDWYPKVLDRDLIRK